MANMAEIEKLVDDYVKCWEPMRGQLGSANVIVEGNDAGCEHLQVFRSGVKPEDFTYLEMARLVVLLTRSLGGQINADHHILWAWTSFLVAHFSQQGILASHDWLSAFDSYVNLLLSNTMFTPGPNHTTEKEEILKHVNRHALSTVSSKHIVAGPLGFALLEGTLRRKCPNYVNTDGKIVKSFRLPSRTKSYDVGISLNRINLVLELLDTQVAADRGRPVAELANFYAEVAKMYPPPPDVPGHIDSWRNNLLHGNEYWQNRNPIIANLLCLLVLDEIPATDYDNYRNTDMAQHVSWLANTLPQIGGVFPPHLLRQSDIRTT